ncbi:S8 family serine peptidase [Anaerovorax odorimutans]|uniref:S8 family serine peptidase n=1 Tax=Anaerovorax odorimutans TaxID=109327 RepID=A0ABT1RRZ2_9FIRM|nr:S8 family serine peptidase [Anaerovorax odorimutans]MCQ4637943.1 S8 family serine peptidase [Anaerovorax odorimutans]
MKEMQKNMKRRALSLITAICLLVSVSFAGLEGTAAYAAEKQSEAISGDYAEDQVIVVFEEDVSKKEAAKIVDKKDGEELTVLNTTQDEVTAVVELPEKQAVKDAIEIYERDPGVAYAQPNYRYELMNSGAAAGAEQSYGKATAINDALRSSLWHLDTIQAQDAWNLAGKAPHNAARVAVLDTGVDLSHPDLQQNLRASLCKDTSYGNQRDLIGDDDGHGTHVAGIIAATANNGLGVAGVASGTDNQNVELIAVDIYRYDCPEGKVEKAGNYAFSDGILAGIDYAVGLKADVINMSMALNQNDAAVHQHIKNAANQNITIVCSAGNTSSDEEQYPSDYEQCISVIATDRNNKRTNFSNYGPKKDLSAPGQGIVSTCPTALNSTGYIAFSGTSMAAPMVSGAAALLYSVRPNLSPDRVKELLYTTATDIYAKGRDNDSGYGIVNAYRAIAKLLSDSYAVEVKLNKSRITLNRGRSETLSATVILGTKNVGILWNSEDPSIAHVDASGKVTARRGGRVTVTAKANDNLGISASCQVTIPYIITYYLNGGINNAANPSGYYGSVTPRNPTRKGYVFAGWYNSSSYRTKVTSFSGGDQTLYAKWTKVKTGRTSIKKLKQKSKTKLKVTYKKISGAKGYQITYSTSKKFSKKKTKSVTVKGTSKTLSKLKKGKTYYVKARAYKTDSVGAKVYGKYSKVKKIRMKR